MESKINAWAGLKNIQNIGNNFYHSVNTKIAYVVELVCEQEESKRNNIAKQYENDELRWCYKWKYKRT